MAMSGGQLLFKLASPGFAGTGSLHEKVVSALLNGYFLAALASYLSLLLIWVWS